jgi:hypothetical protein
MTPRPVLAVSALALVASGCFSVDTSKFDLEVAGSSAYVFRGLVMNDGLGADIQGSVDLPAGEDTALSGYVWGHLDQSGDPADGALESGNDSRFSRLDLGAYWKTRYAGWAIAAGVLNYNFPNVAAASTTEVFGSFEWLDAWYRPRAVVYYDTQNADDLYARVGSHPQYEFDRALVGDIGVDVGYMGGGQARFYYGVDDAGLSDLLLSTGLTYLQDENFRAFLRFGYSSVLSSALKDQNDLNGFESTNAWLSLGCGWTL